MGCASGWLYTVVAVFGTGVTRKLVNTRAGGLAIGDITRCGGFAAGEVIGCFLKVFRCLTAGIMLAVMRSLTGSSNVICIT